MIFGLFVCVASLNTPLQLEEGYRLSRLAVREIRCHGGLPLSLIRVISGVRLGQTHAIRAREGRHGRAAEAVSSAWPNIATPIRR